VLKYARIYLHLFGSDNKNELIINKEQMIIRHSMPDGGNAVHHYEFAEKSELGCLFLNKMKDCLEADGWNDKQDFNEPAFTKYLYKLEAEYEDGKIVKHHGIFDQTHIPEKPFKDFIDSIKLAINDYNFGDIVGLAGFTSALKPGNH